MTTYIIACWHDCELKWQQNRCFLILHGSEVKYFGNVRCVIHLWLIWYKIIEIIGICKSCCKKVCCHVLMRTCIEKVREIPRWRYVPWVVLVTEREIIQSGINDRLGSMYTMSCEGIARNRPKTTTTAASSGERIKNVVLRRNPSRLDARDRSVHSRCCWILHCILSRAVCHEIGGR